MRGQIEMLDRLDAIYVTYWSFRDPLCQSQSLPYVRELARSGRRLGLMTFESSHWRVGAQQRGEIRKQLRAEGIEWLPLAYHSWPPVLSTGADVIVGTAVLTLWSLVRRPRILHSRSTVAGAVACAASALTGARFFFDADGPLADEYAEFGVWAAGGTIHRAVSRAEQMFFERSDAAAVLTQKRADQVEAWSGDKPAVLPCGVDTKRFTRRETNGIRQELGLRGTVFVYAGKWGGWYRTRESFAVVRAAEQELGECSLLVLTQGDPRPFREAAAESGVNVAVVRAEPEEVPTYLSASDIGLCFIVQAPSKLACSPVKMGEYLACGLPIATNPGVGDYSDLVERERVGAVMDPDDRESIRAGIKRLSAILKDDDSRARCREVAVARVSLSDVLIPRYEQIYRRLEAPSPAAVPGTLVISLDFELRWGVRDVARAGEYDQNILGGRAAIPRILDLMERHGVHASWAAVGFLFARDRNELLASLPQVLPTYADASLSPYSDLESIGENEEEDPLSYGSSLLDLIAGTEGQQIASHTFSHFYTLEEGQSVEQFRQDLLAARRIGARYGDVCQSLVLPRNQWNPAYYSALQELGIGSYRTNSGHWAFRPTRSREESWGRRAARLLDAYVPVSGSLLAEPPGPKRPAALQATYFLRPYSPRLRQLDALRLERIGSAMTRAATSGGVFHMWWHPHNFGRNTEENLQFLDRVLRRFSQLRARYGMRSMNMAELVGGAP